MRIDTYLDITCEACGRSRSTGFEKGMIEGNDKKKFEMLAKSEGWGEKSTMTLCPKCLSIDEAFSRINEY